MNLLSGRSLSGSILIFKVPGITVNLLNLSGFLYSESSFKSSSSVNLLASCRYIAGNSGVVSSSLLYNLKIELQFKSQLKMKAQTCIVVLRPKRTAFYNAPIFDKTRL